MAKTKSSLPRPAAILGGNRIPFARSNGPYAQASNQDMFTSALEGLIARFGLAGEAVDEVVGGAVLKHARDFNLIRECVMGSTLSDATPAYDIQQACDTGIQAAILAANKIALGQTDVAIAGGVDTTSDAPLGVNDDLRRLLVKVNAAKSTADKVKLLAHVRPSHLAPDIPRNAEPRTGLSMGDHAAITARKWGITREAQDELTVASHQNLAAAYDRGFFDDLVTPVPRPVARPEPAPGLLAGEAGEAQARLRRGRGGRDDDGGQLDAAVRRRVDGPAVDRRVGGRAPPAGARAPDALPDLGGALRPRRRGAVDGPGLRRPEDARPRGPDARRLRLLRDPRGLRLAGARDARGLGGRRTSAAPTSGSTGRWARSTAAS